MQPTIQPKPKSLEDQIADKIHIMIGVTGFVLETFDELDQLTPGGKQNVFRTGLKYAAKKFREEFERAERVISHPVGFEKNELMMEQMANSYRQVEYLMKLSMEGGRNLSPENFEIMKAEMEAMAIRWGLQLRD